VVDGEQAKPRSAPPEPTPSHVAAPVPPIAPLRRLPATSRRSTLPPIAPVSVERPAARPAPVPSVSLAGAPLRRHRARSSVLLLLLVVSVGVIVAVLVGAVLTALAFALRAAVTS
jgi:hypothetical protein